MTQEQGSGNETSNQVTVARWRDPLQNEWPLACNGLSAPSSLTAPLSPLSIDKKKPSALRIVVTPGSTGTLDASSTYGPDHREDYSKLEFHWYQYHEADYVVRSRLPKEVVLELKGIGRNISTPDVLEANDAGFRRFVTRCW